jgi:hypothetical protein
MGDTSKAGREGPGSSPSREAENCAVVGGIQEVSRDPHGLIDDLLAYLMRLGAPIETGRAHSAL